jgi:porphobilinogen synthase
VSFPGQRRRRLRRTDAIRRLVRETRLRQNSSSRRSSCARQNVRREIAAMPGCFQLSPDLIVAEARELAALGVPAVILFGIPDRKDADGTAAADHQGPVPQALAALAREVPSLSRWADVCLCEYTDHGHCGPIVTGHDGQPEISNDKALPKLAATPRWLTRRLARTSSRHRT